MATPVTDPRLLALLEGPQGRVYSNDEPSPLDPPSGQDRDLTIRTMLAEAGNQGPQGLQAVASVIRNRAVAGNFGGNTPTGVVTARNQFEPWNTPQGRQRMASYDPSGAAYTQASQALERAYEGEDPTRGATHFYAPKAQAALGRRPPSWDDGTGQDIGDHRFFGGAPVQEVSAQSRPQPRPVTDPALLAALEGNQQSPNRVVLERSGGFEQPQNAPALQAGLQQQAQQMQAATRGPAADPLVRQSVEMQNQQIAGGQGTTPIMDLQMQNLITDQVFENDAGLAVFRDPATGQLVEADKARHVILRDPADNRLKVFARSEATNENPAVSGSRILAQGMAAGAPVRRPAIPAPTTRDITPRASDIFASAKPQYREFEKVAGQVGVPTETAAGVADRIRSALDKKDLIPDLAPAVYKAIELLDGAQQKLNAGEKITLDNLQRVKRVIGRSFKSPDKNVRDAAGIASAEINKVISEVSPQAGVALKEADTIHSTARSVRELQNKEAAANLRKGRAGYGGNAVNSMRQVLSPIVQKAIEGKITGFKPHEIEAMREIVEGTTATNVLRGIGQFSPSKGAIQFGGAVGTGAGTALLANPVLGAAIAVGIPALGSASNKLAAVLTGKQIDRLRELVAKRSPAYAEAVRKSVERYEKAQLELINNPAPNKFAAYLNASRQLSNGLSRDGIQITSGELLRAIQGGVKGRTDDEQPES